MRGDLGIEIEVGLAQPVEFPEILIMQDGAEHASQLPESRLVGFVETALRNQGVDDVRFAQRDDTVALRRRGDLARGFGWRMHHETLASIMTPIGNASLQDRRVASIADRTG